MKTLYRPIENNKPGVDAIYIASEEIGWLIQITRNRKHVALNVSLALHQFPTIKSWFTCCITPNEEGFQFPKVLDGTTEIARVVA